MDNKAVRLVIMTLVTYAILARFQGARDAAFPTPQPA